MDKWKRLYKQKTGQDFSPSPSEAVLFDEQHGFCTYQIDGENLVVGGMCGDGRYWVSKLMDIAKENGCKRLLAVTERNPKAVERRLGFSFVGYLMKKEVNYD